MKRVITALILLFCLNACGGAQVDHYRTEFRHGMNTTALAIESSKTTAELLYKAQQEAIIESESKKKPLPTQDEVKATLEVLRKKWDPIWGAYEQVRITYSQLVKIIDSGGSMESAAQVSNELFTQQSNIATTLRELKESNP